MRWIRRTSSTPGSYTERTESPAIVARYASGLHSLLGDDLLAMYLGGSFATGDFVPGVSDYDLLVVIVGEPDDRMVARLRAYHDQLAADDRTSVLLEGDYAPRDALVPEGTTRPAWWFRGGTLREPEHMLSADNIANMREHGIAVFGPSPDEMLPEVSADQVRSAVREMLAEEPDLSTELAAARELLGIARSLAALESGRPTSNAEGMRWASTHVDARWHGVLRHAAEVRSSGATDARDERLRDAVRSWRAELGQRS